MKILHMSHSGLPDGRIEKNALLMKKQGHELIFLGGGPIRGQILNAFNSVYHESLPNSLVLVLSNKFKKEWLSTIKSIEPDLIHAHNIIAAYLMIDTDYPLVYDDHEYWSKQLFKFSQKPLIKRIGSYPLKRAIPKWERSILEKYPVITVSENIAKEHRDVAENVVVMNNYPSIEEVKNLQLHKERRGIVYVGKDFSLPKFLTHRDMTGLKDIIDFDCITGLSHSEMMEKLTEYEIGLTPWRKHPFHKYCNPNKTYEYLHAGLQVLTTESLAEPFKNNPYVSTFQNYEEIPSVIANMHHQDSYSIAEHAKSMYLWENQRSILEHIYSIALSE